MNFLARVWARLRGRPARVATLAVPTLHLGSSYAGYAIAPERLNATSVVYSFGVGEDVSFDLALIQQFGLTVHAFDPTPRSIAWVGAQRLPSGFVLHPHGVAARDGVLAFAPPENPAHISHSLMRAGGSASAIELPVLRLSSIMQALNHRTVDLLKLDIEGAEYEVLEDMLESGISPGQILVEFHHRMRGLGIGRTERTIDRLIESGYQVFHASEDGQEFSLLGPA